MSIAALGGLVSGFAGGLQTSRDLADRRQAREDAQADREWRERSAGPGQHGTPMFPDRAPSAAEGGIVERGDGSGPTADARPFKTTDPVAEGLSPQQRAFLNAIAGGESGGRYDVRYTPRGGETFSGFDQHPGIMEAGPHGPSSASGRYQFTRSTWDDMGGGAFTPERQDMRALELAQTRYRAATGRNLDDDLAASGLTSAIMETLTPTWQAFGSNRARHIATYNDSLSRYGAAAKPEPAAVAGLPAAKEDDAPEWGTLKRIMAG